LGNKGLTAIKAKTTLTRH